MDISTSNAAGQTGPKIACVVPCYGVREQILDVLARIPETVEHIVVVDDACRQGSGEAVRTHCRDPRVELVFHERNRGVGGAVITGYRRALAAGATIVVKLDGDGQMDPAMLPRLIEPLVRGEADYAKGNRFYDLSGIQQMPAMRLVGNAVLSFMAKASSGYWDLFDPTNGYTAVHAAALRRLPLERLSERYFFETDMLFRLNTISAVVHDVPMDARYAGEKSNLRIGRVIGPFAWGHLRNLVKRVFYRYFLRDFSIASLELVLGTALLMFALVHGGYHWIQGAQTGVPNPVGTVVITALAVLMGFQLVLAFLGYDMAAAPRRPLQSRGIPPA